MTYCILLFVQGKPNSPRIEKATCNINSAKIEWISSFNGGDSQTFFALAILDQQKVTRSESMKDRGINQIHYTELQNLQPSSKYVFYVVAKNRHGNSSSAEIECTTLEGMHEREYSCNIYMIFQRRKPIILLRSMYIYSVAMSVMCHAISFA